MKISEREEIDPRESPQWITPYSIGAGVISFVHEPQGGWVLLKLSGTREADPDAVHDISFSLTEEHIAGILVQLINAAGRAGMDAADIIGIADNALNLLRRKFRTAGE